MNLFEHVSMVFLSVAFMCQVLYILGNVVSLLLNRDGTVLHRRQPLV